MQSESTPIDTQSTRSIQAISTLEQRALTRRSVTEKISDYIVNRGGRAWAVIAHVAWFGLWILWNSGGMPGVHRFDPFPFLGLTTIVSLESIFFRSSSWPARIARLAEPMNVPSLTYR